MLNWVDPLDTDIKSDNDGPFAEVHFSIAVE